MKTINVTELKAHLSRYLRLASRGARITVKDRDEPVAELGPPRTEPLSWRDRLVREGRLRPGTQDWGALRISALGRRVDIQASLRAVREDPDEIRRRERGTPGSVR
jgi:antitoxin (DNA-binding transcriptional repressor) of toxin-antitoxin stability system